MNKYKWDLEELRMYKEAALEAMDIVADDSSKHLLLKVSILYQTMIEFFNKKKEAFKDLDDNLKGFDLKSLIYDTIHFYQNNNADIINAVIQSFNVLKNSEIPPKIYNSPIIATNQEIVDLTLDFFTEMTPNYILRKAEEVVNPNNSIVNISYAKQNSDYAGVTLLDNITKKRYIHINRTNSMDDLATLPHEIFHYIFMDNDVSNIDKYNTRFLMEVEGCFSNILFSKYFQEISSYNKDYFDSFNKEHLMDQVEDLVIRNQVVDALKTNYDVRIKKLNKFLGGYGYNFKSDEDLYKYFSIPYEITFMYSLSTLVAIDLYYIYLEDRDKCFYYLRNIKYMVEENNILNLLRNNEITFMDDGYKNLEKYLKK